MAKKVADFLKNLIIKAGGNPEDDVIKAALGNISADLEVADEVAAAIDNGLLSLSTAKNNYPELKNHYFGQAYKGLDAELEALMQAEKLPDEVVAEIKQEGSSTKRAAKLALKIKELEAKKANANKGDTTKLNEQIADLNNQLRAEKDAKAQLEQSHKASIKNVKKTFFLNQLLSGYKTVHDNLDPETKNIILSAVITKHLKNKKADWDIDDSDNFILAGENGTNIFSDDNRLLTPKSFIEKVLADEKMLMVSDGNQNNANNNSNSHNRPNTNGQYNNNRPNGQYNNDGNQNHNNGNGGRNVNRVLQELTQNALNDLDKSQSAGVKIM